jgi:hypothetical protein
MAKPTKKDWGKIHAKAWSDPKFRQLLESDPTKAVKAYAKEAGKNFDKLVTVSKPPADVPPELRSKHKDAMVPPACC